MPLFSTQITLDGNVDSIATLCNFGGSIKKGLRQLTIQGAAANAAANVGSKADVTAGHGLVIVATSVAIINLAGPFGHGAPTNLDEWYIKGTNGNVFEVLIVTQ